MSTLLENLNPEQTQAVVHENGPLLIVAGAGTGKTTVITKRIAWLIENGKANGDEILALTFTDKAAGEMEERVDLLLPYGYVDLWISTFHSFCDRILRDYALDIGLPNNYKLINTTEQWMLIKKNLGRFNLDYYKPFGNPTKFIHALVKHFSRCKDEGISPVGYLAYAESLRLNQDNAESGAAISKKSPARTTNVIQSGWKAKMPALSLPKGKKLKNENENEITELEIKKVEEVANAYHIYQQILLENDAFDFGDLINYTLKLFKERPNILAHLRSKFKYVLVDEFQDTNWAQYELIKMLAAPKNNITCVADDDQSIYLFRGSSVNNVLQFAKDYPKCEEIVLTENYRSKQDILDLSYNFIQQNNPNRLEYHLNQDDVMRERAKEKGIELKDYKAINKKLHSNTAGKAIVEHLHCETLEDEVNVVIAQILKIKEQKLETLPHEPFGQVGNQKLEEQELRIKNQELSKTEKIPLNPSLQKGEINWSDFAILVRANDSAIPFINALERAGIPYQFYSFRGLYNKPVILDITSYFRLLDNYHEAAALYRVLNMPIWKITHKDFSKLNYEAFRRGKSLFYIVKNYSLLNELDEETIKSLEKIVLLIEKHSKMAQEKSVSEIITVFLNDSGYLEYLVKNQTSDNVKNLRYLNEFYKKIKEFESAEKEPRLRNFIEELLMEVEAGDEGTLSLDIDAGPDMVKIMTIHSAKGLEFPYVFITNLVDKKFPTIERHDPIEIPEALIKEILPDGDIHLQEERRLFYVAMTRAKEGLFFTSAENYGGVRKKKISRFLPEMFPNITDSQKLTASPDWLRGLRADSNADQTEKYRYASEKCEKEFVLPKQFSYTQLAAFEKCPLQYKFAHILRIPIKGKGSFSFGKTMHSTLQKFFALMNERKNKKQIGLFGEAESDNLPKLEDLLKIYNESWIDEWYENDKEQEEKKKTGRESLKEFYNLHKDNWPEVLFLEKGFNLKIGNYTLKGSIDRIDGLGDNAEIIDYKTGAAKDDKSIEKEQLLIYQLAAEQCLKIKPEKLTFYYIENNKAVSFLGSDEEIEKLEVNILNKIEKIKNSDFKPTPGWQCAWCDYSGICEHRE
ncbi:MAG: UvrD-helicase domain-containing protein [bacterium]